MNSATASELTDFMFQSKSRNNPDDEPIEDISAEDIPL